MKLKLIDDLIVVYLDKLKCCDIDYNDMTSLQNFLEKLFYKIKKIYKITFKGFYILNIYKDKYYGIIIEIKHEDIDYFDDIEMKINVINTNFLYQTDYKIDNCSRYIYNNKIYLKIDSLLSKKDMMILLENSDIIYDTEDILMYSKKIL